MSPATYLELTRSSKFLTDRLAALFASTDVPGTGPQQRLALLLASLLLVALDQTYPTKRRQNLAISRLLFSMLNVFDGKRWRSGTKRITLVVLPFLLLAGWQKWPLVLASGTGLALVVAQLPFLW